MDDPKGKKNTRDPKLEHLDIDMADSASSMDFTGLIPANPKTENEADSYKNIHEFGNETAKDISDCERR